MLDEYNLKLVSTILLNNKVRQFKFQILEKNSFTFSPGQFVSFYINTLDGNQIKRSYSVADYDKNLNILEFAVTLVQNGVGTSSLCNLELGAILKATAPRGKMIFKEDRVGRHILIGTGTGIVPYKSMLKQIEKFLENSQNSAIIIQGVQNREDMLYVEEFKQLKKHKNFNFKVCFSRENINIKLESYEEHGYVQKYLEALYLNPQTDVVYLCGNPYMIEDITKILKDLNFDADRIIKEQYFPRKVTTV